MSLPKSKFCQKRQKENHFLERAHSGGQRCTTARLGVETTDSEFVSIRAELSLELTAFIPELKALIPIKSEWTLSFEDQCSMYLICTDSLSHVRRFTEPFFDRSRFLHTSSKKNFTSSKNPESSKNTLIFDEPSHLRRTLPPSFCLWTPSIFEKLPIFEESLPFFKEPPITHNPHLQSSNVFHCNTDLWKSISNIKIFKLSCA